MCGTKTLEFPPSRTSTGTYPREDLALVCAQRVGHWLLCLSFLFSQYIPLGEGKTKSPRSQAFSLFGGCTAAPVALQQPASFRPTLDPPSRVYTIITIKAPSNDLLLLPYISLCLYIDGRLNNAVILAGLTAFSTPLRIQPARHKTLALRRSLWTKIDKYHWL